MCDTALVRMYFEKKWAQVRGVVKLFQALVPELTPPA